MFIMLGGTLLITTTNVVIMFCAYECLLLPSWYIIKKFAKTSRGEFAALSMLIWTQLGACLLFLALGLIFGGGAVVSAAYSVYNLSESTTNLLLVLISLGFGTKMPIFPFYWWLLDAHVEVSTNFSIILSGVSIKYAFIAYMRFLDWIGTASCCWPIFLLILYGFRDAMFRIDTECDIKRIVAYQTVVEMHLVAGLVMLNCDVFIDVIIFILGGHCWLSTASFIFVEIISRRYHTRNLELFVWHLLHVHLH
uniref:NADH-ubiquinone oxidoreductase subunit 4 n=1 Tax=Nyctotherus ovalis TaxID=70075 RepID=F1AAJ9_NYCOV|nr:NADH-ubiquinone oxidoreductase subunit 4 [Nyctotherus ovalis]